MITIIPSLDIMKAVTDKNITSSGGNIRRDAFNLTNDMISLADINILLEGILYEKISVRLNQDHKKFFETVYRIDNSTVGVPEYNGNIYKSIKWIASSEAKSRKVVILTDSKQDFVSITSSEIKIYAPKELIDKYKLAKELYTKKFFSSLDDSFMAVLFFS